MTWLRRPADEVHADLIHIYRQSAYLVGRDTIVSRLFAEDKIAVGDGAR